MQNKLVARIANGFGNQMFNYAASYAFSKRLGYKLLVDNESSTFSDLRKSKKRKYLHWTPKYELDIFKISSDIADNKYKFNNNYKIIFRKLLIFLDKFKKKKSFLIEKRNKYKKSDSNLKYYKKKYAKLLYFEGYFESENYFKDYRSEILNEFKLKKIPRTFDSYLELINKNISISISVRRDRFSERLSDQYNTEKISKSESFEKETYNYIFNAVKFFESKYEDIKFFLFSDNFDGLDKIFNKDKFIFIDKCISNKSLEDFYLMSQCKHFIVGPTSFHWWAAWLSDNNDKICTRPTNINPSNNQDFWPGSWIKIDN